MCYNIYRNISIMLHKFTYKNLTWIDLESPTENEVISIIKDFSIQSFIGESILSDYARPRIERYPDSIYMVLRIPIRFKVAHSKRHISTRDYRRFSVEDRELVFIIGRNFIVTAHKQSIPPLENFAKVFETDSIIAKDPLGEHAGLILYYLIKKMYAHMENDLDSMRDSLMNAEAGIFDGYERRMVEVLSNISRELIDLKQSSRIHKETIELFGPIAQGFFGQDYKFRYADDIIKQYAKIHELTGNNRELLTDLRETNDSLLSTKQNEIMQTLTIIASIIFPLELVTGIFSMNTAYTPIVGHAHDFLIIMGILAGITLAMMLYFKYKRWV